MFCHIILSTYGLTTCQFSLKKGEITSSPPICFIPSWANTQASLTVSMMCCAGAIIRSRPTDCSGGSTNEGHRGSQCLLSRVGEALPADAVQRRPAASRGKKAPQSPLSHPLPSPPTHTPNLHSQLNECIVTADLFSSSCTISFSPPSLST